jgi:hypothetical protein
MAVTFALTVDAGPDPSLAPVVTADFDEAASEWAQYLNSNATIRVEVDIGTFPSDAGLAIQSDYTTFIPVGTAADGETLVEPWGMYALTTGNHAPGSPYDIHITIGADYLGQIGSIYFNPNPADGGPVPADMYDAVSLFRRELARGLGLMTMTTTNAVNAADQETPLDRYVVSDPGGVTGNIGPDLIGAMDLTGPAAEAVYGGPVPLLTPEGTYIEGYVHVGNTPTLGSATDLMGPTQNLLGRSVPISPLDLAIMRDAGVPIITGTVYFAESGQSTSSTGMGDTIVGAGSAPDTAPAIVFASGSNALLFGGSGPMEAVLAGTGVDSLIGGSGEAVIFGLQNSLIFGGNTGPLFVSGAGEITTVVGGTGASTLFGGSSGTIDFFNPNAASQLGAILVAAAGNETLNAAGSTTSNVLFGGSGNDAMLGGSGNDVLLAGTGSDTMTGGGGTNVFSLTNGEAGGADLITDFNAGDFLLLSGYGSAAAHTAFDNATFAAGSMTIVLPDSTRITFLGVSSAGQVNYQTG